MVELLCTLLRGGALAVCADQATRIADTARQHEVHLVLAHRLGTDAGLIAGWPSEVAGPLQSDLREAAVTERITRLELMRVLGALDAAGVPSLIFKGAALAFTHYALPATRPRRDVDLLVRPSDVHTAAAVIDALGYTHPAKVAGALLAHQKAYVMVDRYAITHLLDLHWRISNRHRYANLQPFEDLAAAAVAVPPLGPAARALSSTSALLVACVHRIAHHHDDDLLLWLYDIHLLAERLTEAERDEFLAIARAADAVAACDRGLRLAHARFRSAGLLSLADRLVTWRANTEGGAPSTGDTGTRGRQIDDLRSDLHALDTWPQRLRLIREHLFPPASYMQQKYRIVHPALLPVFYVWRVARGARRWFTTP